MYHAKHAEQIARHKHDKYAARRDKIVANRAIVYDCMIGHHDPEPEVKTAWQISVADKTPWVMP